MKRPQGEVKILLASFSRISVKTPVCVPIVERGLEEIDDFPRKSTNGIFSILIALKFVSMILENKY